MDKTVIFTYLLTHGLMHYGRSRSSMVIDFGSSQKSICNLLLVIIGTLVQSCTVLEIQRLKGRKSCLPSLIYARGDPFRILA